MCATSMQHTKNGVLTYILSLTLGDTLSWRVILCEQPLCCCSHMRTVAMTRYT